MNNLAKTIKQVTGLSIGDFCAKELNTDYKAFNWRVKNNRLYPDEIFYMIWRTRKSVQELFGKSWHELVIDNSAGPVVKEVKDIIGKMTDQESKELEHLLGLENYQMRAEERVSPTPPAERKPLEAPKEPVTQAPDPEPPPEEPHDALAVNPLSKFFKNTY